MAGATRDVWQNTLCAASGIVCNLDDTQAYPEDTLLFPGSDDHELSSLRESHQTNPSDVDALRADVLGLYGDDGEVTPTQLYGDTLHFLESHGHAQEKHSIFNSPVFTASVSQPHLAPERGEPSKHVTFDRPHVEPLPTKFYSDLDASVLDGPSSSSAGASQLAPLSRGTQGIATSSAPDAEVSDSFPATQCYPEETQYYEACPQFGKKTLDRSGVTPGEVTHTHMDTHVAKETQYYETCLQLGKSGSEGDRTPSGELVDEFQATQFYAKETQYYETCLQLGKSASDGDRTPSAEAVDDFQATQFYAKETQYYETCIQLGKRTIEADVTECGDAAAVFPATQLYAMETQYYEECPQTGKRTSEGSAAAPREVMDVFPSTQPYSKETLFYEASLCDRGQGDPKANDIQKESHRLMEDTLHYDDDALLGIDARQEPAPTASSSSCISLATQRVSTVECRERKSTIEDDSLAVGKKADRAPPRRESPLFAMGIAPPAASVSASRVVVIDLLDDGFDVSSTVDSRRHPHVEVKRCKEETSRVRAPVATPVRSLARLDGAADAWDHIWPKSIRNASIMPVDAASSPRALVAFGAPGIETPAKRRRFTWKQPALKAGSFRISLD